MKARQILIWIIAAVGIYCFLSWCYSFHLFKSHEHRVDQFNKITLGTINNWTKIIFIIVNLLALILLGLSSVRNPYRSLLLIWFIFITLFSIWSIL